MLSLLLTPFLGRLAVALGREKHSFHECPGFLQNLQNFDPAFCLLRTPRPLPLPRWEEKLRFELLFENPRSKLSARLLASANLNFPQSLIVC